MLHVRWEGCVGTNPTSRREVWVSDRIREMTGRGAALYTTSSLHGNHGNSLNARLSLYLWCGDISTPKSDLRKNNNGSSSSKYNVYENVKWTEPLFTFFFPLWWVHFTLTDFRTFFNFIFVSYYKFKWPPWIRLSLTIIQIMFTRIDYYVPPIARPAY